MRLAPPRISGSRTAEGHALANKGERLADLTGWTILMIVLAFAAARSASSIALRQHCQRSWSKPWVPGRFPRTAFQAALSRARAIAYSSSRFTESITTPKLLVTQRCNSHA
jgi:hypothetical protein